MNRSSALSLGKMSSACLAAAITAFGPFGTCSGAEQVPWWLSDHERAAGPRCLAFAAKYLGQNWSYGKVARAFPEAPDGATLEQIQTAARSLGLHAEIYEGDAPYLGFSPFPVIVGHRAGSRPSYRVIIGRTRDDQGLRVFEFPAKLETIDHRSFGFSYPGRGLVVATRSLGDIRQLLVPRVPLFRRGGVQLLVVGLTFAAGWLYWSRRT